MEIRRDCKGSHKDTFYTFKSCRYTTSSKHSPEVSNTNMFHSVLIHWRAHPQQNSSAFFLLCERPQGDGCCTSRLVIVAVMLRLTTKHPWRQQYVQYSRVRHLKAVHTSWTQSSRQHFITKTNTIFLFLPTFREAGENALLEMLLLNPFTRPIASHQFPACTSASAQTHKVFMLVNC